MSVLLETSLGDLVIDLDAALSPPAAENFLHLCRSKAYANTLFHTLLPGFLVQAGLREPENAARTAADSRSAWARIEGSSSGSAARGAAVFEPRRSEKPLRRGDVCLACTGPENRRVAGAQWFVVLGAAESLDGKHALIGSVVEGMEEGGTMEKIEKELCDGGNRPLRDIRIRHVEVLDDPVEPLAGLRIPSRTPSPTPSLLLSARPTATLSRSPTPLPDADEETKRRADANAAALTLEMVGDIAHADVRPPENILFVCKLNPVTRSEDLRLIFGRFGEIRSCEVIRDRKSGDSLQYAFIEFDEQSQAEQAYFKMQNVLVDDRRIWVDFSQSVGKLHASWLAGRGGGGGGHGGRAGSAGGGSARGDTYRAPPRSSGGGMVFDFDERAPPPPARERERRDDGYSRHERRERERSPRRDERYDRREYERRDRHQERGYDRDRDRDRDEGRRSGGYGREREERYDAPPRREYGRDEREERRREERGDYSRRDRERDGRR